MNTKLNIALVFLLIFSVSISHSQNRDTTSIFQLDSLLDFSHSLAKKKEYDAAFLENQKAEDFALKIFGKDSKQYCDACQNHGSIHELKIEYSQAEAWYQKARVIREKHFGTDNVEYATNIQNIALMNYYMGNYDIAVAYYLDAKKIREKILGVEHEDYTKTLTNLAVVYKVRGEFDKAESLILEVLGIREKTIGKDHTSYLLSLNNLASLYKQMGRYERSEEIYKEVIEKRIRTNGKESEDYALTIKGLGSLYFDLGLYTKAEEYYLESLHIREKKGNTITPEFADCCLDLAILYKNLGQFELSETYFIQTKNLIEKIFGRSHQRYAAVLNSMGNLYIQTGNYQLAEPLYLEAKAIREKTLGTEHANYATSLHNLALLYKRMGNIDKVESLYQEAIRIKEKVFGKEHPDYAISLGNLAKLYKDAGQYEKAEPIYLEVLAIREKSLGADHPDYAAALEQLGTLNLKIKKYDKSKEYYEKSQAIIEKKFGIQSAKYGTILNDLGEYYFEIGAFQQAEALYLAAKDIREKALGLDHNEYEISLESLAYFYWKTKDNKTAYSYFKEAEAAVRSFVLSGLKHLSEYEMEQYLSMFRNLTENLYTFLHDASGETNISETCYDNTLFYKGFLLNASLQNKKGILADSIATAKYKLLQGYGRELNTQYLKPIAERKNVTELEEKSNALEKELAKMISHYDDGNQQVKWTDVEKTLTAGEAAIEFIHYKSTDSLSYGTIKYAALILKKGLKLPQYVPLFDQTTLESLMSIGTKDKAGFFSELYSTSDRGFVESTDTKKSLKDILWAPLASYLQDIQTIYFSPSGLLHRINFDAISLSPTRVLSDQYNVIQLNSTRQLVFPDKEKRIRNNALLYGGIRYDQDTTIQQLSPVSHSKSLSASAYDIEFESRGGAWNFLPGTEHEILILKEIIQLAGIDVRTYESYHATEATFKEIGTNNVPSPWVIHLATHGYFFPDPKKETLNSSNQIEQIQAFKMSDHPMLRSGLIMAGGNSAWNGLSTAEGHEDGILTAFEISQMNLSNTELVVLSACETGLGEIKGNEGVYGLQRALKIAGAKYIIMSLWQIPDKQTSLLMNSFYKKWIQENMTIPMAFHAAQKELRDLGFDPFQWAGFVLVE